MRKYNKMLSLVVFSCILLGLFSSCGGAKLMSNRAVETHLEKLYGEEFEVTSFENVPSDNLGNNVHKARVYRVMPKNEPEFEFFAFSIIRWETGGIFGFSEGFTDNFMLEKLRSQLLEDLNGIDADYEVSYRSHPFDHTEVYYSGMNIFINVSQDNLYSYCIALSTAFKDALEEIPSTSGFLSGITIVMKYHDNNWEEGQVCSIVFTPFYGSDLKSTKEDTREWSILDIEVDTIYNICLQEIQRYAENHGCF